LLENWGLIRKGGKSVIKKIYRTSSSHLPWRIRHVSTLYGLVVLFLLISVLLFLLSLISYFGLFFILFLLFLVDSVLLFRLYKSAERFASVVFAMDKDIIDAKFENHKTLKVNTSTQMEFFLLYHPGDKNSNAHYKVWITTTKKPHFKKGWHSAIWHKPSISEKLQKKEDIEYPEYLSPWRLEEIESLYSMWFDTISGKTTITALLNDKMLSSETQDLLKTLEVLREIERSL
jgi:hypothetical protein